MIKEKWEKIFEDQEIDTSNSKKIKCNDREFLIDNRMFLMSIPIKTAFEIDLKEKQTGIYQIDDDFKESTIENAVGFVNGGNMKFINDMSYEEIKELYVFADKYDIELLKQVCLVGLKSIVTIDNSKDALKLAKRYEFDDDIFDLFLKYYIMFKESFNN